MRGKNMFEMSRAQMIGKCKYCKTFSPVAEMSQDKDGRPYHEKCCKKENMTDETLVANMVEKTTEE